jgi:hypothetical protein
MFCATVKALAKRTELLAHENTLLAAEVRTFRKANEALSKLFRAINTSIRQGGYLPQRTQIYFGS